MGAKPKIMSLMLAIAALAFLPGCWTYSLHSLYRDDDPRLAYDPTLTGTWENRNSDCQTSQLVIAGDSKSQHYTLQLFDKGEIECHSASNDSAGIRYAGNLVQLGTARFLDVVPGGDAAGMGAIPAHSILKIVVEHDSLFLVPVSDSWLCSAPEAEQYRLGECIDGDFVLTASSDVLQDFVQSHADDDGVFPTLDGDATWHRAGKSGGTP
jgi:hypothetical protein